MSTFIAGKLLAEGKTKKIFALVDNGRTSDKLVIVENKSDITAHDNPKLTRKFGSKAVCATTTTCRVFELLRACGIPTAFQSQLNPTAFIGLKSKMVPLEVVARRYAVGSYLKRHPELITEDKTKPKRFHRLEIEFFLKTTGGKFGDIFSGLTDCEGKIVDDPFIVDARAEKWQLVHPKKPKWTEGSTLRIPSSTGIEIPWQIMPEQINKLEEITRQTFLILEKAWGILGLDLIDLKIEFDDEGRVSDVVDNDSWRLWQNGRQLDKQVFRDHGEKAMEKIEENYQFVAALSERLRLPRQALVFWRGSDKDPLPKLPAVPGVIIEEIVASGHKKTVKALSQLDRLVSAYPQGGAIVSSLGRSNGLSPILAAHTTWPVISCPADLKESPHNVWSSISMPSDVPLLVAWPETNALDAAIGILAQNNPAAYMRTQMKKENFDDYIS